MSNRKPFITIILVLTILIIELTRGNSPQYVPQAEIRNPQSEIQYAPYRDLSLHISSMKKAPSSTGGMRQDSPARISEPAVGEHRALVILIEFTDEKHSAQHNQKHFDDLIFSREPEAKSMYNYYQECSYGQFSISPGNEENNPTPWLESDHSLVYYNSLEESNSSIWKLAENALEKAVQLGIDLSAYDEDGDGRVNHLIIVHAGGAEEDTGKLGDLGSHRWEIKSGPYAGQGYTLQAETSPLGIFAHEFGHDLGLPDLYVNPRQFLVHDWSLMDHGAWLGNPPGSSPAHPCAWSKAFLGWITPQEAPSCGPECEVYAIETHKEKSLFKLSTSNRDEYFLVSNRQRIGFDAYLPGEGILIWHIDDSVGSVEANNVNSNYLHPRVYLEQADGRNDLLPPPYGKGGPADDGDPYSSTGANDQFGDNTTPNSRDYAKNATGIEIRVLDPPGERMTVLMKNNCQESTTKVYAAANPFILSQHPDGIGIYLEPEVTNPILSIYDLNGQLVHTATGGEKVSRGL
ncbi:MAG: M6 family metalloprotease domain-containing protein, partial [bacterium]|nr:M6 family metalloprotease domain-containing protein [bacterium]